MHRLGATVLLCMAPFLGGCLAMRFVPAGAGVKGAGSGEIVRFASSDGLMLEGRMFEPRCDRLKPGEDPAAFARLPPEYGHAVILHCHGVADNDCSAMASFLNDAGFRVFQFDYRGFGHSDAAPLTNPGLAQDAIAALHYLRSRPDVDPDRVLVYGHSMGAAYALATAAQARAEGRPVRAVITADGFSSWRMVANYHVPILGFILGGVKGPDPTDWLRRLGDTPLLILHVQDDDAVPVENAFRLYRTAVAAGVPASLHIHPDGGHAFPFFEDPESNTLERAAIDLARLHLGDHPPPTSAMREADPWPWLSKSRALREDHPPKENAGGDKGQGGTPRSAAPAVEH